MLRTNSKKYLHNIQTFLVDSVDTENYVNAKHGGMTSDDLEASEKIAFVMDCYNSEFNHDYNVKQYPNEQDRFANWLAGLPSCISIPFYYSGIIALSKKLLEADTLSEKMEDRICKNYFQHMALHILKLHNNFIELAPKQKKWQAVELTGQPMIEWMMIRFNWTEQEALSHIAERKSQINN